MAKVFTEHFMGLAERLADKTVGQFDPTVLKALVDEHKVCDSKLAFPPITPSQTHQLIKAIPSCKPTGLDSVSARLEQGPWRTSSESSRLPPVWPGFKFWRQCHMWVEFVCLLLVLSLALRGFSPGTPVFPFPQKPTFPNSNSTRSQVDEEPLCGCATCKSLFIYATIGDNKHPNFEWRGQGRGVDSSVLWSYPIWVQCLNNFVADCLNRESATHP